MEPFLGESSEREFCDMLPTLPPSIMLIFFDRVNPTDLDIPEDTWERLPFLRCVMIFHAGEYNCVERPSDASRKE